MRLVGLSLGLLLLALPACACARDALAVWNNRCEQCHGDAAQFARKYLWDVGGELQGRHHIEDLHLFMQNHYIPAHEIDIVNDMLLGEANRMVRFASECGECHGDATDFVRQSIWIRKNSMTALKSGMEVSEFLPTHQGLSPEDVEFYLRLLVRVAP